MVLDGRSFKTWQEFRQYVITELGPKITERPAVPWDPLLEVPTGDNDRTTRQTYDQMTNSWFVRPGWFTDSGREALGACFNEIILSRKREVWRKYLEFYNVCLDPNSLYRVKVSQILGSNVSAVAASENRVLGVFANRQIVVSNELPDLPGFLQLSIDYKTGEPHIQLFQAMMDLNYPSLWGDIGIERGPLYGPLSLLNNRCKKLGTLTGKYDLLLHDSEAELSCPESIRRFVAASKQKSADGENHLEIKVTVTRDVSCCESAPPPPTAMSPDEMYIEAGEEIYLAYRPDGGVPDCIRNCLCKHCLSKCESCKAVTTEKNLALVSGIVCPGCDKNVAKDCWLSCPASGYEGAAPDGLQDARVCCSCRQALVDCRERMERDRVYSQYKQLMSPDVRGGDDDVVMISQHQLQFPMELVERDLVNPKKKRIRTIADEAEYRRHLREQKEVLESTSKLIGIRHRQELEQRMKQMDGETIVID